MMETRFRFFYSEVVIVVFRFLSGLLVLLSVYCEFIFDYFRELGTISRQDFLVQDFLLALWLDYILIKEGQIRIKNMNKRLSSLLSVRNAVKSLGDVAALVTYNMIGFLP